MDGVEGVEEDGAGKNRVADNPIGDGHGGRGVDHEEMVGIEDEEGRRGMERSEGR